MILYNLHSGSVVELIIQGLGVMLRRSNEYSHVFIGQSLYHE